MADTNPTTDDLLRSELLRLDVLLRRKQTRWEMPRAVAMILLAFAAVFAAGGISTWLFPPRPQIITVQFGEQPLHVQLVPPR